MLGSPLVSNNIQVILAFIIIVLGGVVGFLYRRTNNLSDKIDTIQAARLQDAKDTVDKVTQPLASISQTMNLIYDKLRSSKES